jgi:membrane protease YdiL (CAAX protease family)
MKWIAPALAYLAIGLGLFVFHHAWGALLAFHLAIVLSLLIAKPDLPLSILGRSRDRKWILLSILLCGSSGVTLYYLWNAFGLVADLSTQVQSLGLNERTWPPFIAYFVMVNPFIEEYFWRGYLGDPTYAPHRSDFLYAGFHALIILGKVRTGTIFYALLVLVLAGWFWRQIMREDQGLLASVLGHMAADLTIALAIYLNL